MSASPKISSFTIIVTFLCVALAGIAFIPLLPIKLSPSRTLPQLTISYNMPGNSARVIEMEVTSRLEAMLARIKGIKEINSTSGNGWGYVTLELDKHTNIDAARFEASTIIRQTWPSLPDGLSYHELHTECGSHTHIYTTLCRRPNKTSPKRDSRHLPHRRQRCHPDGMATGI